MPILKLKLIKRYAISENTHVFAFEKPNGFTYKPGQYGGYTLINPTEIDQGGLTRRFSFLSAPHDDVLSFATRIRNSAYKRMLNVLPIGGEIKFAGPTGNFTLHDDINVPAVFIAGGIGITPFYSMLQHSTYHPCSQQLYLFFGNHSLSHAPLLAELQALEANHPRFKFIPTLAVPDKEWKGETGFITVEMIKKHIPDIFRPIYYVCGSPTMVTAMQEMLAEMGIDEDRIKVEDFPGY